MVWKALTEARTEEAKRIRRQYQRQRRDWNPRREKELRVREDGLMNSLTASPTKEHLLVKIFAIKGDLLTRKNPKRQMGVREGLMFTLRGAVNHFIAFGRMNGTNTALKSTRKISMKNQTQETLDPSPQKRSQTTTCSVLAGLASRLALLERGQDLRTPGGLSFLRSLGFSETKDPDIFSLKTSKVCLVTKLAKLSRLYLGFSPTWGIDVNGRYLTASTSAFPKTGSGYSLSDVLEERTDGKYFLSAKQTERIVRIMKQQNV